MFSIIDDAWTNDPVKEMTKKYSDIENECVVEHTDTNANNKKNTKSSKHNAIHSITLNSDDLLTEAINVGSSSVLEKFTNNQSSDTDDTECQYYSKHFRKCNKCNNKIRYLVNKTIDDKIDGILLNQQLKNAMEKKEDDSLLLKKYWKDLLIVGLVILLFVLIIVIVLKK